MALTIGEPIYLTYDEVLEELSNKLTVNSLKPNAIPPQLFNRWIRQGETKVENDLKTFYNIPFKSSGYDFYIVSSLSSVQLLANVPLIDGVYFTTDNKYYQVLHTNPITFENNISELFLNLNSLIINLNNQTKLILPYETFSNTFKNYIANVSFRDESYLPYDTQEVLYQMLMCKTLSIILGRSYGTQTNSLENDYFDVLRLEYKDIYNSLFKVTKSGVYINTPLAGLAFNPMASVSNKLVPPAKFIKTAHGNGLNYSSRQIIQLYHTWYRPVKII